MWVWYLFCDIEESLSTEFGNGADKALDFMAEINRKLEKTA